MISDRYDVDPHALTIQALKDLAKGPTDKNHHKQLAELSFKMSLEHQRADRIEAASQHLELADGLARRLKSSDMLKQAAARRAEIAEYKKLVETVAAAEKTLDENLAEWQKLTDANAHPAGIGVCVTSDGVYHSVSLWHGPK